MARKNAPALQRLLDACRKAGSITQKAWQVRTKRPAVKFSAADRKEKRLRWLEKKTTYNAAINEIHKQLREAAAEVRSRFPDHTLERVITDVFQSQRLKDSSKDISRYSAFTSLQMRTLNANTPEGQPRQKVNQLSHIIAEKWRGMTEEERVAATEDKIVALHERRENKELGMWHNADVSATHDSSMTVSRVKEELTCLAARTGDECILVVTRGSLSRFRPPETYCSSEKSESFLSMVMKTSGADLAMCMDAFMVLGVEGVAHNHVQILTEMKSKVSALILQKLKQCAGKYEVKKMFYTNFEEHVMQPFGIVIKNWPLKEFKNPSSISTRADVSILWNAWETGTAHFYMMTREEHQAWEQKQDEALVEARGRLQGVREKHAAEQTVQEEHSREAEDAPAGGGGGEGGPPHAGEGNPPPTPTTTFVHATVITDASGVAVHSHSRTRKKRSDAGKPRKKRKTNISRGQEGGAEA
ncbi:hypothetical protein HHX47_DHR6000278 [Lentinula edodes]|nr:hypothetical protein HHX47_DHR6000278 [Lentinula edodes]